MHIKIRLFISLLAGFLFIAPVLASKTDDTSVDQLAIKAKEAITAAMAARNKARSVEGEWRDTGKLIRKAKAAYKAGAYERAIKLAQDARIQGELGYAQAISQQELKMPSYFKQ